MRTGGDHKKYTCGRKVDVGVLLSAHLIEGQLKHHCCNSARCGIHSTFFFNSTTNVQEIHGAHLTADA